jgi:hypothetical protein
MKRQLKLVMFRCVVVVLLAGSSVSRTSSVLKRAWDVISPRSVLAASSDLHLAPGSTLGPRHSLRRRRLFYTRPCLALNFSSGVSA